MSFKKYMFSALLICSSLAMGQTKAKPWPDYEHQIDSVMALMNLDAKIGQLNQLSYGWGWGPTQPVSIGQDLKKLIQEGKTGSFLNAVGAKLTKELQKIAVTESPLKIPLIFGFDVIHGVKTTFPIPLAESCTWDMSLIEKSAATQAKEAYSCGVHWTFAPMVDIARDPRWGRIAEGNGEDTYLGSQIAAARIKGIQGDNLAGEHIIACPKHFAAYGAAEGGRDYNTVDISERTLREIYLPPFKAAIDAGAQTIMCSFNVVDGIPASVNKHLLTDILRNEWKFSGFVVSDWSSIGETVAHGISKDNREAAKKAITAGLDMDMEARAYITHMKELIEKGEVPVSAVDDAVRNILRVKFRLGLFSDPFRFCDEKREATEVGNEAERAAALEVTENSLVLLKNTNNVLPLAKSLKKIAVIGPLGNSKRNLLGCWEQFGDTNSVVTVLEGLQKKYPGKKITFTPGCSINNPEENDFSAAVKAAKESELVVLVIGEDGHFSGEASARSSIEIPGAQNALFDAVRQCGKPVVVVLMNGRPLAIPKLEKDADAILEAWFGGITAGEAIANALSGDFVPCGKLTTTFPLATGQVPIYYNHKNTGRPAQADNFFSSKYIDLSWKPLFPFGYGLSYTTFTYSDLAIEKKEVSLTGNNYVTVKVTNSGKYKASEVVQLYINRNPASVTRPVRELKDFQKITLNPGETKTVKLELTPEKLSFYNDKMEYGSEPGTVTVYVGTNSLADLSSQFTITSSK
jgi:beta-glucosidase